MTDAFQKAMKPARPGTLESSLGLAEPNFTWQIYNDDLNDQIIRKGQSNKNSSISKHELIQIEKLYLEFINGGIEEALIEISENKCLFQVQFEAGDLAKCKLIPIEDIVDNGLNLEHQLIRIPEGRVIFYEETFQNADQAQVNEAFYAVKIEGSDYL